MDILDTKTKKVRKVHSTLDWVQYAQYHRLGRYEQIIPVDHWMCWKRSEGFKPLCKRPVTTDTLKSESLESQPEN